MKYEKWSLGYELLKQYVRFADWIIHNKTTIIGIDKIPKKKPVLFAPNHQNALSDPMAVLLNTKFQPVWLARADIFKNKIAATILRFLKIMPVYRLRDGKDNMGRNKVTFTNSIKVLKNNGALALFPEAAHTGKRQIISHKKAVPRIVFMAEQKAEENLDIQIVPTGIFYSSYWKFNRNLLVNFGEAIPVNNYIEELKKNERTATESLRNDLREAMEPLVVDIKSKDYYNDFEIIRELTGNHFRKKCGLKKSVFNQFKSDQVLTKKLDEMEKSSADNAALLISLAQKYNTSLKKLKIRNWLLEKPENNLIKITLNGLVLIISLPVFLFGFIFNAIPFFTIDFYTRKMIKDIAFWSTFFLVLGIVMFPLVYLVELLVFSWLIPGIWLKLVFLFSLPFAGKLAFKWYILFRKTVGRCRLILLKWTRHINYQNLINEQRELYGKLDQLLSSEYLN